MLEGDVITLPGGVRGAVVRVDDEAFEVELGYGATHRVSWREVGGQRLAAPPSGVSGQG